MFSINNLPFKVDKAKSGRSKCFECNTFIVKDTLRIARLDKEHFGKMNCWYHEDCFFVKQRPKSVNEMIDFHELGNDDQQRLINKVDQVNKAARVVSCNEESNGQSTIRLSSEVVGPLWVFKVESSETFEDQCRHCDFRICKGDVRVSKVVYDTDIARKYNEEHLWYHVQCFAEARIDLQFFAGGETLPGFDGLTEEDQGKVKDIVRPIPEKVPIIKTETDPQELELQRKLNEQNDLYQKYKSELSKLSPKIIKDVLKANHQIVTKNKRQCLNLLADCLVFGALQRCGLCGGQLQHTDFGYKCTGYMSDVSPCINFVTDPKRFPLEINPELAELLPFQGYQPTVDVRLFRAPPQATVKKEEARVAPLKNLQFFICGLNDKIDVIKTRIYRMGGLVVDSLTDTVAAVVSTESEIHKMNKQMTEIKEMEIEVVDESFFDQAENENVQHNVDLIIECNIADWGSDPFNRVPPNVTAGKHIETSGDYYVEHSQSIMIKGGQPVWCKELAGEAHVYEAHSAVLTRSDAERGNRCYRLQLLQSDYDDSYYVYIEWSEIGSEGANRTYDFYSFEEAMEFFKSKYHDKTLNEWECRNNFIKHPGKYYHQAIDFNDPISKENSLKDTKSDLPVAVQGLVKKIFDIEILRRTMRELHLDVELTPLGKISNKQIAEAYKVLSKLLKYIEEQVGESQILDASNRFYYLIPHKGDGLPALNSVKLVHEKIQLLDDLSQIELAYTLIDPDNAENNIEAWYRKLNTDISPLDKSSPEFRIIEEYVRNTHSTMHSNYSLEIEQAFTIARAGEDDRYKPFKELHNRRLLWHGSRVNNIAGILSQGLRIAPPEAPVTGYMFGKGIYFADMVSKSANYCRASSASPVGLLLLCEVALGNMKDCTTAEHVTRLPPETHSVWAVGRSRPDPARAAALGGALVPLGPPVPSGLHTSLLHNEYVVYDTAQVNIKYLLQMRFKF